MIKLSKKTLLLSAAMLGAFSPLIACGKKHDDKKEVAQKINYDTNSRLIIAKSNINDLKPVSAIYLRR